MNKLKLDETVHLYPNDFVIARDNISDMNGHSLESYLSLVTGLRSDRMRDGVVMMAAHYHGRVVGVTALLERLRDPLK